MHAARLLLRRQAGSGQSTLASLLRLPFAPGPPPGATSLLLEADSSVFAGRFSSAGASNSSPNASSSTRQVWQSLDTRGAPCSQREHQQATSEAGSPGPSPGHTAHSDAARQHVPERAAAAFEMDQPGILPARRQQRPQEEGGGSSAGTDRQRAYATRAATRSFVLPNAVHSSSSSPWGDGPGDSLPHNARDQPIEFDFPAKAYYIGACLYVSLA